MPASTDPFMPGPEWAAIVAHCAAKLPGMSGRVQDYYLARDECSWANLLPGELVGRTAVRAMAEAIRAADLKAGTP